MLGVDRTVSNAGKMQEGYFLAKQFLILEEMDWIWTFHTSIVHGFGCLFVDIGVFF